MTRQFLFSFFLLMVTVLDLNKIIKFLKLGEYYTLKKRTLIANMLVGKKILMVSF